MTNPTWDQPDADVVSDMAAFAIHSATRGPFHFQCGPAVWEVIAPDVAEYERRLRDEFGIEARITLQERIPEG